MVWFLTWRLISDYANLCSTHLGGMDMLLDPSWTQAQRWWWFRPHIPMPTFWEVTCGYHHAWWRKGQDQISRQASEFKFLLKTSGFCSFKAQTSVSTFLRVCWENKWCSLTSLPTPPLSSQLGTARSEQRGGFSGVWNETNQQANSRESWCVFNMQAPCRGLWRKSTSSYWNTSALEREPEGGEEMYSWTPQHSHFLKKPLIKEKMWGTNCSHLPNISKGFKITQGIFFPGRSTKSVTSTPSAQTGQCLETWLCCLSHSQCWPDTASIFCLRVKPAAETAAPGLSRTAARSPGEWPSPPQAARRRIAPLCLPPHSTLWLGTGQGLVALVGQCERELPTP